MPSNIKRSCDPKRILPTQKKCDAKKLGVAAISEPEKHPYLMFFRRLGTTIIEGWLNELWNSVFTAKIHSKNTKGFVTNEYIRNNKKKRPYIHNAYTFLLIAYFFNQKLSRKVFRKGFEFKMWTFSKYSKNWEKSWNIMRRIFTRHLPFRYA